MSSVREKHFPRLRHKLFDEVHARRIPNLYFCLLETKFTYLLVHLFIPACEKFAEKVQVFINNFVYFFQLFSVHFCLDGKLFGSLKFAVSNPIWFARFLVEKSGRK